MENTEYVFLAKATKVIVATQMQTSLNTLIGKPFSVKNKGIRPA
jgi:hypothetical protein